MPPPGTTTWPSRPAYTWWPRPTTTRRPTTTQPPTTTTTTTTTTRQPTASEWRDSDPSYFYTPQQIEATTAVMKAMRAAFADQLADQWQGDNFCLWEDVFCATAGLWIYLFFRDLQGVMPAIPDGVSASDVVIWKLFLTGNPGITGTLDQQWYSMPTLERLDLRGSAVEGVRPDM